MHFEEAHPASPSRWGVRLLNDLHLLQEYFSNCFILGIQHIDASVFSYGHIGKGSKPGIGEGAICISRSKPGYRRDHFSIMTGAGYQGFREPTQFTPGFQEPLKKRKFALMNEWINVTTQEDFYTLLESSSQRPQIIFKDSTTCGISAYAKERLKNGYSLIGGKASFHYLDLLTFRPISNLIAQELKVTHQSPQIIVLKDKKVVYTTSHHAINPAVIAQHL